MAVAVLRFPSGCQSVSNALVMVNSIIAFNALAIWDASLAAGSCFYMKQSRQDRVLSKLHWADILKTNVISSLRDILSQRVTSCHPVMIFHRNEMDVAT